MATRAFSAAVKVSAADIAALVVLSAVLTVVAEAGLAQVQELGADRLGVAALRDAVELVRLGGGGAGCLRKASGIGPDFRLGAGLYAGFGPGPLREPRRNLRDESVDLLCVALDHGHVRRGLVRLVVDALRVGPDLLVVRLTLLDHARGVGHRKGRGARDHDGDQPVWAELHAHPLFPNCVGVSPIITRRRSNEASFRSAPEPAGGCAALP